MYRKNCRERFKQIIAEQAAFESFFWLNVDADNDGKRDYPVTMWISNYNGN
jgi:hypothetical protein